jgi:hypothetical protein
MKSSDVLEKGAKLLGFLTAHGFSLVTWLALAGSSRKNRTPETLQNKLNQVVIVYITDRDLAIPTSDISVHVTF